MTRRRWLLLGLIVLAVGGAVLLPYRWSILGTLRGEPFFQGMPASYWSHTVADLERVVGEDRWSANLAAFKYHGELTGWDRVRKALGVPMPEERIPWMPILVGEGNCLVAPIPDPSANPVLLTMSRDENAFVRWAALNRLKVQVYDDEDANVSAALLDVFRAALADPDPAVRLEAATVVASAPESEPERVAAILREGLHHESVAARRQSILALVVLGAHARAAVPELPQLLETCDTLNLSTWSAVVAAREQLAAEAGMK